MDNKKGSKLLSIIEKLSEQCVRADDESAPSQYEENETSSINEDIVVVQAQPPRQKTFARTKFGKFKKVTKKKPPQRKPKRSYNTNTKMIQAALPLALQTNTGPTLRKSVRGTLRKKLPPKPSQVCQPIDEDLCIDVTALMSITPQVKDIDNDHNYSCRQPQTKGGNCRLCQRPVKNKKDFLKHFKKFHPECIKKPKKKADPQPEPQEEEELPEEDEEEENEMDRDASSSDDSDYDPAVDPDMSEAENAVLTQRRSQRLAKRQEEQQEKVTSIKLALNKLPLTKRVFCQVCLEKFYFKIQLTCHLSEEHNITELSPDETLYCEHCSKKYPSRERLINHIKKVVRKIQKINCDDELRNLILDHEDECERILKAGKKLLQRFPCDKCDKKFVYKGSLNKHMATHSEDRPFGCKQCGKGFKDKEYLRRHMQTHTGEKKYKCDICDRKLAHKGSLRSHRMIHTGERPYKCQYCDAQFISRYQCSEHEQIKHLGRAPHKCDLCSKTFTKANHLRTHLISHSNEKPHSCEVCGKAFKRRDHLRYHLIIHSDVKPYKCDTCGRTFNQHICLRKHLPCREFERQAKKKEKSSTETKTKKSKADKTVSSPSISQPQQNEDVQVPPSSKKPKLSSTKTTKDDQNDSSTSIAKDVEVPNKISLNELLPEQLGVSASPAPVVQEAEKTSQTIDAEKEPEDSAAKKIPKRSRPTVTEKQSSGSKKPRSSSSKTRVNHSIPTEETANTGLSTTSIPPLLERPRQHPTSMAPSHKDTNLNFDRLDFGFQTPGQIVSGSSPGNFNLPMQRLLESSYMSNMPQTFVPINSATPDTASVVFESGGLDIYQGTGNHDNMRALSHDSAAADLSSALLAAMDPDHINNIVNPASFFPQT